MTAPLQYEEITYEETSDGTRVVGHGGHVYTARRWADTWELERPGWPEYTYEMSWADVCSRIRGDG